MVHTGRKEDKRAKPRLTMFRGNEGPTLGESGMMANSSGPEGIAGLRRLHDAGIDNVGRTICLYRSPDRDGFSLILAWFKGRYTLPPHSHNTDCLYYIVSGSIILGSKTLGKGDGFFIGAGGRYTYTTGPDGVEILEFRSSTDFDIKVADAKPAGWRRLVEMVESNLDLWRTQKRPQD